MEETITIDLFDTKSIDRAIKQLNKFKADYQKKTEEYTKAVADECLTLAQGNWSGTWYDDIVTTGSENDYAFAKRTPAVYCDIVEEDDKIVLTAHGYDAVWVEFGAGITHNGLMTIGSNPNPLWDNTELVGIGEYGKKQGRYPAWNSPKGLSRGTLAQMPMYNALVATESNAEDLAKEIFK